MFVTRNIFDLIEKKSVTTISDKQSFAEAIGSFVVMFESYETGMKVFEDPWK